MILQHVGCFSRLSVDLKCAKVDNPVQQLMLYLSVCLAALFCVNIHWFNKPLRVADSSSTQP